MEFLSGVGIGSLVASGVFWLLAGKFLPAYVAAKGKNLATKEDVDALKEKLDKLLTK